MINLANSFTKYWTLIICILSNCPKTAPNSLAKAWTYKVFPQPRCPFRVLYEYSHKDPQQRYPHSHNPKGHPQGFLGGWLLEQVTHPLRTSNTLFVTCRLQISSLIIRTLRWWVWKHVLNCRWFYKCERGFDVKRVLWGLLQTKAFLYI